MKLKNAKLTLNTSVDGTVAIIIPDTINGDSLGIASGKNLLKIKLSDLVDFIAEQEKTEQVENSSCPA